jgi:hypothetical protein
MGGRTRKAEVPGIKNRCLPSLLFPSSHITQRQISILYDPQKKLQEKSVLARSQPKGPVKQAAPPPKQLLSGA